MSNEITDCDTEKTVILYSSYKGSWDPTIYLKGKRYCTQDTMIGPVANRYKQQKAWPEEGLGRNYNRNPRDVAASPAYIGAQGPYRGPPTVRA